jgi:ankyrin repeat protein
MNGAARILFKFGADLSCEDELGHRAIHHAIINTQPQVLKILLEAGEAPSGSMHDGKSCHQACRDKPQCLSVLQSARSLQAIDLVIRDCSSDEQRCRAGYLP